MNPVDNPYTPGAGTPPHELAGREEILQLAINTIKRTKNNKTAKSQLMLGLRGVGKTVLLNRIYQIAESEDCQTAIFEADPNYNLPELLIQQLHRLLLKLDRRKKAGDDIQKAFNLLRGFANAFKVRIGEVEVELSYEITTGDLMVDLTELFVSIGTAAKKRNTVVIIFVDELQYLVQKDFSALILALHRISQNKLPILFFGAGLPQLAKLAGEAKSYAERLFDYPEIDKLNGKSAKQALVIPAQDEGILYEEDAIKHILEETEGYPFFLQLWGSCAWEIAPSSPITLKHARVATKNALRALDSGFFRVRFDRLTPQEQDYACAMAEIGDLPVKSTKVAEKLEITVKRAAPIRARLIKKGMAYSPGRGLIEFTVPKFEEFLKRRIQSKKVQ